MKAFPPRDRNRLSRLSGYRRLFTAILPALLIILFIGCEEEVNRPIFRTLSVTGTNFEGVTLNMEIVASAGKPIERVGFIWTPEFMGGDPNGLSTRTAFVTSFSPSDKTASLRLSDEIEAGVRYTAQAFIISEKTRYLGNKISFMGFGSATPVINSFKPSTAGPGEKVRISGEHFSSNTANIQVKIGPNILEPVSSSVNEVVVQLPMSYVAGRYPIHLNVADKNVNSTGLFTMAGPIIDELSPSSGPSGTSVTIKGSGFKSLGSETIVRFEDVTVGVETLSNQQITLSVPSFGIAGNKKLVVSTGNITSNSVNFAFVGPTLTSVSPASGKIGSEIVITGKGFSATASENQVLFDNFQYAEVIEASTTALTVRVPQVSFIGIHSIVVSVGGTRSQSTLTFEVEGPKIDSFSPASQYPGRTITITGRNFEEGISNNYVAFNGWYGTVTEATSTSITAEIPFAVSGAVSFSVMSGGLWVNSSQTLTILSTWKQEQDFPGVARTNAGSFVLGNFAYVGLGKTYSGTSLKDIWRFDPSNKSWLKMRDFPGTARYNAFSFTIGNKAYFGGGANTDNSSTTFQELWEYNVTTDKWTQRESFSITEDMTWTKLPSFSVGNYGCFLSYGTLNKYDSKNDSWSTVDMPAGFVYPRIAWSYDGKAYAILASSWEYGLWEFNSSDDSWTRINGVSDLPGWADFYANIGSKLYVGNSGTMFEFDIETLETKRLPDSFGFYYSAPFAINNLVYCVTGGSNATTSVFSFDPNY